jgi:galactitol-specific phosphotransferase system IIB component
MKLCSFLKHTLVVLVGVMVLLVIPFLTTDYAQSKIHGTADAVSSASVIIDQPSGNYIVLINRALHQNQENLNTWVQFFSGEEISYLFEDISCSVASGDSGALTMAQSFMSRLPEKQMSVQTENATLLMSRADCGKYDIIILSKEFAESYDVTTIDDSTAVVINVIGGSS